MNLELVEAARAGDAADIERLIEGVWTDAYRLARAITGEANGAQDVAQEACIVLYRSIATLRDSAAFRTWFYRIIVREATRYLKRRPAVEPECDAVATSSTDSASSIDLWRALAALPKGLRDVVVLHYFEDLSSREIASVLRIPDSSVRFRLMMARRRLKPMLGENILSACTVKEGNLHAI